MRRKQIISLLLAMVMTVSFTACGKSNETEDVIVREGCVDGCTCTDCVCCGNTAAAAEDILTVSEITQAASTEEAEEETTLSSITEETVTEEDMVTEEDTETIVSETVEMEETETATRIANEIELLTEGEKAARREQQANFAEAREGLYKLKNSKDKTTKINQMDKQILANNSYDFSKKNVVFIGDSITEGITASVDQNGNFVSYVTYANSYLHFQRVLNHGMGGRMFSAYGGEELSLALNFGNVTNVDSDIIVVFAGVNDYLSVVQNKRFGDVNDTMSTAGYCGSLRYFMKQLKEYYSDRDIFFVTMYNVSKTSECTYSDYDGQPTLGDYMEAERQLAEEYGFNIIELYDTGFMDCTNKESADYYLRDGLHPKDNGNIVLGEHIAAELSLYFSQKEE